MPADVVVVIAEAGVNHNGDLELARQMVDIAAEAGADFVKFQTFSAERLVTAAAEKADYQKAVTDRAESQFDMLKRLELSRTDHAELKEHCSTRGIGFLSTPFDEQSADYLVELGVDRLKVPSGEVTNIPYLKHIGGCGLPILMSTGMCNMEEVGTAVKALEGAGCKDITLLHCLTEYPADPAEANLRAMESMAAAFGYPVGYSDHTQGEAVALAAVALGACVIEKHFTIDRNLDGPDHAASLEPEELCHLINGIRIVKSAIGDGGKVPAPSELSNRDIARKSLASAVDIAAGEVFSMENLIAKRPGTGIPPARLESILGRRARVNIAADTMLSEDMIA